MPPAFPLRLRSADHGRHLSDTPGPEAGIRSSPSTAPDWTKPGHAACFHLAIREGGFFSLYKGWRGSVLPFVGSCVLTAMSYEYGLRYLIQNDIASG